MSANKPKGMSNRTKGNLWLAAGILWILILVMRIVDAVFGGVSRQWWQIAFSAAMTVVSFALAAKCKSAWESGNKFGPVFRRR